MLRIFLCNNLSGVLFVYCILLSFIVIAFSPFPLSFSSLIHSFQRIVDSRERYFILSGAHHYSAKLRFVAKIVSGYLKLCRSTSSSTSYLESIGLDLMCPTVPVDSMLATRSSGGRLLGKTHVWADTVGCIVPWEPKRPHPRKRGSKSDLASYLTEVASMTSSLGSSKANTDMLSAVVMAVKDQPPPTIARALAILDIAVQTLFGSQWPL